VLAKSLTAKGKSHCANKLEREKKKNATDAQINK
jgi:hypothetical protein